MRGARTLIPPQKVTVSHFWGAPSFLSCSLVPSSVHKETRTSAAERKSGIVFWLLQSNNLCCFKGWIENISLLFFINIYCFLVPFPEGEGGLLIFNQHSSHNCPFEAQNWQQWRWFLTQMWTFYLHHPYYTKLIQIRSLTGLESIRILMLADANSC